MTQDELDAIYDVLLYGPLSFRLEELGRDEARAWPDVFQGNWGEPFGIERLIAAISDFFAAQQLVLGSSWNGSSAFLRDVVPLMVQFEQPGWIFHGAAKTTMMKTISRLLCLAGWQQVPGNQWNRIVTAIDPNWNRQTRSARYLTTLQLFWRWNNQFVTVWDVFEDEIEWARERNLWTAS